MTNMMLILRDMKVENKKSVDFRNNKEN